MTEPQSRFFKRADSAKRKQRGDGFTIGRRSRQLVSKKPISKRSRLRSFMHVGDGPILPSFEPEPIPQEADMKICVLGANRVGKSSLVDRLHTSMFLEGSSYSDSRSIDVKMRNNIIKVLDIAGYPSFNDLTNAVKFAEGFVFVYDVQSAESFSAVQVFTQYVNINSGESGSIPTLIIANQAEDDVIREISIEEGQQVADLLESSFMEVSAKTGMNVVEAFSSIVNLVQNKRDEKIKNLSRQSIYQSLDNLPMFDVDEVSDEEDEIPEDYGEDADNFSSEESSEYESELSSEEAEEDDTAISEESPEIIVDQLNQEVEVVVEVEESKPKIDRLLELNDDLADLEKEIFGYNEVNSESVQDTLVVAEENNHTEEPVNSVDETPPVPPRTDDKCTDPIDSDLDKDDNEENTSKGPEAQRLSSREPLRIGRPRSSARHRSRRVAINQKKGDSVLPENAEYIDPSLLKTILPPVPKKPVTKTVEAAPKKVPEQTKSSQSKKKGKGKDKRRADKKRGRRKAKNTESEYFIEGWLNKVGKMKKIQTAILCPRK
eukprot:TRINITY_DN5770_c0_g1_i2.p1 TRINITY_DN5770_c0_g1~~TRINITY_DN5770_c0_g1_i2.p1  ORF type:complete len:547 (-),score=176.20 TRINITY_DN5770_c0_g1_i2:962-2602(-)